ncbi:glycosyltransferase family 4 protein [Streptomyces microflavus]|uniref:glycosyltransferase family 4 protein n=1 Tax=Streptomyces microflavus TaxID=1919 RepID=UPI0036556FEF
MRILALLPAWEQPEHLVAMAAAGHEVQVVTTTVQALAPYVDGAVSVWPLGFWWQALQATRPDVVVRYAGDGQAQRLAAQMKVRPLVVGQFDADVGEFAEACVRRLPARQREALREPVPPSPLAGHRVRVVAWIHYGVPYRCAGSETMLQTMMRTLQDAGMGVLVVCSSMPEAPPSWSVDGVPYVHLGPHAAELLIRRVAPQVVVTHHNYAPRAVALARTVGARSALLMHSDHAFSARVLAARPDLVVYNTEWVRESLAARYREVGETPGLVVHPPVIPGEHRTDRPGARVTLVNLNRDKGVEAFRDVARALPHLPFLGVAGAHGQQVRDGMPANVQLVGQTSQMREEVWARTRLLVAPSVYESYGMGAVEAIASGIPVLAHPTPGLREALGDAGVFIDRADLDGWVEAVMRLYRDGPDREAAVAAAVARSAFLAERTGRELAAWGAAVGRLAAG